MDELVPPYYCMGCDLVTEDWETMDAHATTVALDPVSLEEHKAYTGHVDH